MPFVPVNGVQVNFPFEPYPCQISYMEKVIQCLKKNENGVLESPTGTGKTLCLLCSTLAWLQDRKAQTELNRQVQINSLMRDTDTVSNKQIENMNLAKSLSESTGITWGGSEFAVPKIIYASRTHSQLTQAVQEMKRTAYNSMKVSVIGSREQLCIHEQIRKETSNTNKVHMCKAKVLSRTCHYYNHFEEIKKNSDARQLVGPVVDIEDLSKYGEKQRVCPYYLARELKNDADIIFMPYNYLLDPKSRKAHGVEIQGNIIIFDEAHNLEKICEDSSSFDLTSADIATAIEELQRLANKLLEEAQAESESLVEMTESSMPAQEFDIDDLLKLKATFKELEDRIDEIEIPKNGKGLTKPGVFIFELFSKVNLTFESKNFIIDKLEKIVGYITGDGGSSGFTSKGAGLSKLNDVIKIVFSREVPHNGSLLDHQTSIAKSYKVHLQEVQPKKTNKLDLWTNAASSDKLGRTLSYWCFSPGHTMADLTAHGIKCIILTSGTLSPIDSFTAEMQIPFPIRLENPHVIEKHQVWIGTLGKGPDGVVLNSNYETRFNASYQSSLGNAIVNFARIVPNGLLIFFPSYPVMEKCLEYWQANNIWNRITQYKQIFVEPRGKTAFYDAMDEFYEKINDQSLNGAIFAAVCRGKVSEGLDFSDINGRAVVITGLPYPPRMDPKVILKMQFLDEMKGKQGFMSLSGSEWYRQQASRAVNQAIGRVIRHKQDYGAIMLCDTRFSSQQAKNQLPVWVRPHVSNYGTFGQALKDAMVFFKTAEKMMPAPQTKKRRASSEHIGAQGAYFQPTISRSGPKSVEQARTIAHHVPSLKNSVEDDHRLKLQYEKGLSTQSGGAKSGRTLLDALENNEKYKSGLEDDYSSTNTGISSFQRRKSENERKKMPGKRKIVVKNITSTEDSGSSKKEMVLPLKVTTHLHTAEDYIKDVKSTLCLESYKLFSRAMVNYKKDENFDALISVLTRLFTENYQYFHLFRSFYRFVRPRDKKEFDAVCRERTGAGCGYKPEDSISKKRLQTSASDSDRPEKKQKLLEGSLPTNIGGNLTNNVTGSCSSSTETLNSGRSNRHNSGDDLFDDQSASGSSSKPDQSETVKLSERLKHVNGPLDITHRIKEISGYTCCLCKQDATQPFKSACEHICCFKCWKSIFESDKLCPECHVRVRRRHLTRLCFSGPNVE